MIKVALTGNIGSGKSTVASIFKVFGIPVFNADIEARSLYYQEDVKDELRLLFSDSIFLLSGEIDTKILASIIFNDTKSLKAINKLIHPLVLEKYILWCNKHAEKKYSIHEAAIIFENNLQNEFDYVINVSAPSHIRLKRVMERDGISKNMVEERMASQLSDKIKCELSQFVINNDGSEFLIPQVESIHNKLLTG